jgi:hypothetical protein
VRRPAARFPQALQPFIENVIDGLEAEQLRCGSIGPKNRFEIRAEDRNRIAIGKALERTAA